MKLLLFSDLHCDVRAAERLIDLATQEAVDVLVGAGDFGTKRSGIELTLDVLRSVARPVVLVAGNAESDVELADACRDWANAHVLHGSGIEVNGMPFFGLGAAVPETPFGSWSFDLTEEQAADLLADCPMQAILVTHSPPRGVLDTSSRGENLGSEAVRATIATKKPRLAVCGHIHDSAGKHDRLGDTPVVNAGPAGIVWQLPD
jgi:Icc-related predicted phosphoesterase